MKYRSKNGNNRPILAQADTGIPKTIHFLILSIELLKFIFQILIILCYKLIKKRAMLQKKMQMNIILDIHHLIPDNFSK